jgi:hypothetical protein
MAARPLSKYSPPRGEAADFVISDGFFLIQKLDLPDVVIHGITDANMFLRRVTWSNWQAGENS